eukprot:GHVR01033909.1.p1 GENE.GHVR01033909.1~~GHVR01033909.1.p1  ORF type:complete len:122 (+),score=2.74 GHVR01033909.1:3119-3484(+)
MKGQTKSLNRLKSYPRTTSKEDFGRIGNHRYNLIDKSNRKSYSQLLNEFGSKVLKKKQEINVIRNEFNPMVKKIKKIKDRVENGDDNYENRQSGSFFRKYQHSRDDNHSHYINEKRYLTKT